MAYWRISIDINTNLSIAEDHSTSGPQMLSLLLQALAISCAGSAFGLSLTRPSLLLPNPAPLAANVSDSLSGVPGFGELDGLRCFRSGPRVDFLSCENAWRKIPLNSDDLNFRHRHENPPADTMYVYTFLRT